MNNDYLLLIDGSSLLSTQYYGNLPREIMFAKTTEDREKFYDKIMQTSDGIYTNAIYGFMRTFIKILKEQKPKYIAVAWDISRDTFRRELYSEYKGTRGETPAPLKEQFKLCQDILKAMNVPQFMDTRYEADDFCGTLAKKFEEEIPVRIYTKDNDYLQLVSDNTRLWLAYTTQEKADELFKKYNIDKDSTNVPDKSFELTPELVKREFGVKPCQIADLKGLIGDKSDNIKGVTGVGEASAVPLLCEYETIENLYNNIRDLDKKSEKELKEYWKTKLSIKRSPLSYLLKESEEDLVGEKSAIISKKLAVIKRDIDLGELEIDDLKVDINEKVGNDEFEKLQIKSINLDNINNIINSQEVIKDANIIELTEVSKLEELQDILNNIGTISYFSYKIVNDSEYSKMDLDRIILYSEEKIYNINWFNIYNEDSEKSLDILKNFMENSSIDKVIHNAKALIKILYKYGIELNNLIFDTSIAGYIIDSSKGDYTLSNLVKEYLGETIDDSDKELKATKYIKELYENLYKKIKEDGMEDLLYNIELPLIYVLASMEVEGFRVDKKMLRELETKFKKEIEDTQRDIYELADEEFNINSPKQLGKILFEKLDLPVIKKTKTGYSTNAEVLEKLEGSHEIIPKIMYYRQITKLNSTYVEGLQNVIDEDGHIHSNFNQTVTTTGRLSSTEPNLQNIPIKYEMGREIRKVFIPEEKGDMILSCDYSQIELRVLAHMSEDKNMIDSFNHHSDIHRKTASEVFNVPVEDVTPLMRSRAKAVNFGIIYGMSDFSLGKDLNIPRKEAKEYMDIYFNRYPNIKKYLDGVIESTIENGYITTMFNRRRFIKEIESSNKITKALGERLAMNAPIQGTAADIIKIAMIKVYNRLKEEKLNSKLILQVHDELILNVKSSENERVMKIVQEEMENAVKLSVPLDVDINEGMTWYEAK